jgi:hypothetical protein
MNKFLVLAKNSTFGLVVILWGLVLLISTEIVKETSLSLWFLTFTPATLGWLFIAVGVVYVFSKCWTHPYFAAFANISIASIFLLAMLTHLFASLYAIAWIAFAGICLNQIINAILLINHEIDFDEDL